MKIEEALDLYTSNIIDNDTLAKDSFVDKLSPRDYKEFLEEAEMVDMLFAYKSTSGFEKLFSNVLERRDNMAYDKAANFRSEELSEDERSAVEDIFDEIFTDK